MATKTETKPTVKLIGVDGNVFVLLGRIYIASKEAGLTYKQWNAFYEEAISGDYNDFLRTTMNYFEVI